MSAIHAGIRKRVLNVELAPPRLAEARACSAEALAEATVPVPLLPKAALPVSQPLEEAFWLSQPHGCAVGRVGWAEPPEHRGQIRNPAGAGCGQGARLPSGRGLA